MNTQFQRKQWKDILKTPSRSVLLDWRDYPSFTPAPEKALEEDVSGDISVIIEVLEGKFNPHHSTATGQFVSGAGGAGVPTFTNWEAGQQWLIDQHQGTVFNFAEMPTAVVNEITPVIHQFMQDYPKAAQRIDYIGMSKGGNAYEMPRYMQYQELPEEKGSTAVTYASKVYGVARVSILFNAGEFTDVAGAQRAFANDAATGWSPAGTSSFAGTVAHELGHAVFNGAYYSQQYMTPFTDKKGTGKIDVFLSNTMDRHGSALRNVSGYARSMNVNEGFADAFSQYRLLPTNRQSPVAKDIGGAIDYVYSQKWQSAKPYWSQSPEEITQSGWGPKRLHEVSLELQKLAVGESGQKQEDMPMVPSKRIEGLITPEEFQQMPDGAMVWVEPPLIHAPEVGKFNPHHGPDGRFAATAGAGIAPMTDYEVAVAEMTQITHDEQAVASLAGSLHAEFPGTKFNFTYSTEENAQLVYDQIRQDMKAYPEVGKTFKYVGTEVRAPTVVKDTMERTAGMTIPEYMKVYGASALTMHVGKSNYMIFNSELMRSKTKFDAIGAEDEKVGWHAPMKPGTRYLTMITKHEFGHGIINFLLNAKVGAGATFSVAGLQEWIHANKKIGMNVSGYGLKGGVGEALAEGYAQSQYAVHPRAFSVELMKYLGGIFDKNGHLRSEAFGYSHG